MDFQDAALSSIALERESQNLQYSDLAFNNLVDAIAHLNEQRGPSKMPVGIFRIASGRSSGTSAARTIAVDRADVATVDVSAVCHRCPGRACIIRSERASRPLSLVRRCLRPIYGFPS